MTLKLNGSTAGSVSIDAPADTSPTGTDVTLTLPTSAGSSGQYLQTNGSGVLSWVTATAGTGRILQIQSASHGTQTSTSSTSYQSTGLSASITPSATSSKIIIVCTSSATPSVSGSGVYQVVRRGTTDVTNLAITYNDSSAGDTWRATTMFGVDSPSTTSSTTYTLYFRSHNGTTVYEGWGTGSPRVYVPSGVGTMIKAKAIDSIRPGAEWVLRGDDLEWLDAEQTEPTTAEIEAEIARLTAEQPWVELRQRRDQLLAETDWVTLKAIDASNDGLGIQLPQVWMDYRQALRDLPANTVDPANPVWPVKPGGAS